MEKERPNRHNAPIPVGYSSPPCYAHEWDADRSDDAPLSAAETVQLLATLATAERDLAEIAAAYLADGMPESAAGTLRALRDSALQHSDLLLATAGAHELRDPPREADQTPTFPDLRKRLEFLAHRCCCVAQQIRDTLPRITHAETVAILETTYAQHLLHITEIESLLALQTI